MGFLGMSKWAEKNDYDFLIGNTTKYDCCKPRTDDVFKNQQIVWSKKNHKTVYWTKVNGDQFMLQGPYQCTKEIAKIQAILNIFKDVYILPSTSYGSCYIVPESKDNIINFWFIQKFGDDKNDFAQTAFEKLETSFQFRYSSSGANEKEYCIFDTKKTCQLMKLAFFKNILQFKKIFETCFSGCMSGYLLPFSLEKYDESKNSDHTDSKLARLFQFYKNESSEYAHYVLSWLPDKWKDKWIIECAKYELLSCIIPKNVTQKYGWPTKKGDRIMTSLNQPGTVSSGSQKHALLDPHISQEIIYITFDLKFRSYDLSHIESETVAAKYVRPMTDIEKDQYPNSAKNVSDVVRPNSHCAFYIGDVVKIFSRDIHNEDPVNYSYKQLTRDFDSDIIDIALVVDNGSENKYWRTVLCYTTKKIKSFPCCKLYWVKEDDGAVVRFQDAESKQDTITFFNMLESLKPFFEDYLIINPSPTKKKA